VILPSGVRLPQVRSPAWKVLYVRSSGSVAPRTLGIDAEVHHHLPGDDIQLLRITAAKILGVVGGF